MLPPKEFLSLCTLSFILASCIGSALLRPAVTKAEGPLYTDLRWIVDGNGLRVKLACVNWSSHLQTVLAEGLDKQPVHKIISEIMRMGFNCVRFTWPVELVTNDTLSSMTVVDSFTSLGLAKALAGIETSNPWAPKLTLIEAFESMLRSFEENNVMIVLDNHLTVPGWCCNLDDGNGFFGDKYFDPDLWLNGLSKMATLVKKFRNVISMSIRNELRGPKSNVDDWYRYMQEGAEAVHAKNPNVLVILSGLNFDLDLSFLRSRPVNVSFARKIVFELHWYSFSDDGWMSENLNHVCRRITGRVMDNAGFLSKMGIGPLFVSEFGVNNENFEGASTRFLSCFLAVAADQDWDFAVWTIQGSYYLRENVIGMDETYGLLDYKWTNVRNSTVLNKLASIQAPFRGPGVGQSSTKTPIILFHPFTGFCVAKPHKDEPLRLGLGPCKDAEPWMHLPQGTLQAEGRKSSFLLAIGDQKPVEFDRVGHGSKWNLVSKSKMHLSGRARDDNKTLCLDVDNRGNLVTNGCKCLQNDKLCDPTSQWFKLVETSIS